MAESDDALYAKTPLQNMANYFSDQNYEVIRIKNAPDPEIHLSYINSFILGDTVFMPIYAKNDINNDRLLFKNNHLIKMADKNAMETYQKLGFKVIPIPSIDFITRGGAIHCITRPLY